jgi:hypothetical protein
MYAKLTIKHIEHDIDHQCRSTITVEPTKEGLIEITTHADNQLICVVIDQFSANILANFIKEAISTT